jgi:DNA invertase Pin-like site-specific DNA recombinase
MVTRLDQLARSTRDLLNTLAAITAKKVGFKSLGDTWADTTTSHGVVDADGARRAGGVRTRPSPCAHRRRTGPRQSGPVKLGRKTEIDRTPEVRGAICRRDPDGEPLREIARSYNVSHSTIHSSQPSAGEQARGLGGGTPIRSLAGLIGLQPGNRAAGAIAST